MRLVRLELSYGGKPITVEVPEGSVIDVLEVPAVPPVPDPEAAVVEALWNPVGTRRLRDLATGKRNAVIMVPDRTRPAPLDIILPQVLQELAAGGIGPESVTILIGLGTHRAMTTPEIEEYLGADLVRQVKVLNHEWWDPRQLIDLGRTRSGIPIQINRVVYEADLKIALGGVKPHRAAGWSGGAKMIQPGVSGPETTGATHWLSAQFGVEEILGKVDNPVRREMEDIAARVGLDFCLNYVLNNDYRLVAVYAGHYIGAHRHCVEMARPFYIKRISELADIVLAGCSAAATNMWANGAGPNSAELVIKPGGTIVLFAPCPDGVAREHPEVLEYGYIPFTEVKRLVEAGVIKDKCAAAHIVHGGAKLHRKNLQCILVSEGVTATEASRLRLEYATSPQEAVDRAFRRHGARARCYVYPGYTFAELIIEWAGC
ncbi:MAG: nickel-dependent lactate racemase [Firmicutes bacterium]|nr:nickel-dependent lactate racemase [Bacillota bacterium]